MKGRVFQINIKPQTGHDRGIPKSPVNSVRITKNGPEGDHNKYRAEELASDPDQAVLLFTLEMIRELNDEGWPVRPGDIGENITTEGLDYGALSPGSVYVIGDAIVEITKACVPCRNLAILPYVGTEKQKEFISTLIDRRGWYARVVREGMVHKGDAIEDTTR